MSRFAVFTVDHDEQQLFIDYVNANDNEEALDIVLDDRPECCHGQAFTCDELHAIADTAE